MGPSSRLGLFKVRRLAIVLIGAWCLGMLGLAGYDLAVHRVGYFVMLTLPVGTTVSGNQATLPDGRVIGLETTVDVKSLRPGMIEWNGVPGVVELQLRTLLLAIAIGVPLLAFGAAELVALAIRWILRGSLRSAP